jgi:hypothetical protein
MTFGLHLRPRHAAALTGALLLTTACIDNERSLAPAAAPLALSLSLDVSSLSTPVGEEIAIDITPSGVTSFGGVQGFLRFDANRLEYVGQSTGEGAIVMVNKTGAERGALRIGALDLDGVPSEIGTFVFRVKQSSYYQGLGFDVEEATTFGNVRLIKDVDLAPTRITGKRVPAEARHLTGPDWVSRVEPGNLGKPVSFAVPGQIVNGLVFGDANLSGGAVTLSDATYLINVSLGLSELIVGTDSPARDAVIAGNTFPGNAPGCGEAGDYTGGNLPPGWTSATNPGDITLADATNVIAGFTQPTPPQCVGTVIPGRPATPASNRIIVNTNVTGNVTWTKNNIYELSGGITVTNGATLTIEPGTLIEGQRGSGPGVGGAALFVARDGKIIADGTPLEPIVMTCVAGPTPRFKGCWGGVSILGNAVLNDGTVITTTVPGRSNDPATSGTGTCPGAAPTNYPCREKAAEGNAGQYGGANDDDNSGILRYVRIEYAGFRFTPTNELNGLALYAVGRGTIVDYVQVHAGLDDGIEMFGGTVNLKHLVLTANSDDSYDYTEGYRGKTQFVIIQHDSLDSDKGFEMDNYVTAPDATPRATPQIWNVTMIGKADPAGTGGTANNNSVGGFHIRVGTRPNVFNVLAQGWAHLIDLDDASTCATDATGGPVSLREVTLQTYTTVNNTDGSDPAGCGSEEVWFATSGWNNTAPGTTNLVNPFNVLTPDFRPTTAIAGATPPSDGFFDTSATYRGAVPAKNVTASNIPWYSGWTRGWQSSTTP